MGTLKFDIPGSFRYLQLSTKIDLVKVIRNISDRFFSSISMSFRVQVFFCSFRNAVVVYHCVYVGQHNFHDDQETGRNENEEWKCGKNGDKLLYL